MNDADCLIQQKALAYLEDGTLIIPCRRFKIIHRNLTRVIIRTSTNTETENMSTSKFYELSATTITGKEQSMEDYSGVVILVVNVASQCGFTPQYAGLQKLYERFGRRGFVVLGFPCDQFGHQEPGTNEEISQFCQINYGVTFPMFAKIEVNGKNTHPLIQFLKDHLKGPKGKGIQWNFTKFLIDKDGTPLQRFEPAVTPEEIAGEIENLL